MNQFSPWFEAESLLSLLWHHWLQVSWWVNCQVRVLPSLPSTAEVCYDSRRMPPHQPFYVCNTGPGNQTQVFRLDATKFLYPLIIFPGPYNLNSSIPHFNLTLQCDFNLHVETLKLKKDK